MKAGGKGWAKGKGRARERRGKGWGGRQVDKVMERVGEDWEGWGKGGRKGRVGRLGLALRDFWGSAGDE
jgi:hypothetical protein